MKPRSNSFTYLWYPDFVRPYIVFFTFSLFYVTQSHQQIAISLYLAKCLQVSSQIRKLSHFLSFLASLLGPISATLLEPMLLEIPFWPTLAIKVPKKRPVTSPMLKKAKKALHNYPQMLKPNPKVEESDQAMNPTYHPIQQKQTRKNHDISVKTDLEISQATYKKQQPLLWRGSAAWAKPLNYSYSID